VKKLKILLMLAFILTSLPAYAAEKWNDSLSRLGSEQAGNADGSIPEWLGGIVKPPAAYQKGGFYPDPFSDDKPLFIITAENWTNYKDKLSPGQQAMFQKYSDYKMPVYVSRRSAAYPDFVYDAIKKNADLTQLTNNGDGVKGGGVAVPFPVAQNGLEAIWNHLLRYRGASIERTVAEVVFTSPENSIATSVRESIVFPHSVMGASFESAENVLVYFKQDYLSPPRRAGTLFLVHETLDKSKELRRVWLYNPGQRRVSRAPFSNYDSSPPTGEGLRTYDQYDMYNGATDRYDWTLEGKQEIYIPYNAYRLAGEKFTEKKFLGPHFLNTDLTRFELHRVWKVNAVLKEGKKHIYARRVFYLDEDSWQIVLSEEYDGRGNLWRYSEAHVINFYDVPLILPAAEMHYDLKSGQYIAMEMQIEPTNFFAQLTPEDFTPDTLRREGNR
jgi:hypothetical protein